MNGDFNIKIADFGLAALPDAKDNHNGILTTNLGTTVYKAPEILEGGYYNGEKIDLFAASLVLFTMYTRTHAFKG